jgi:hypothetical protein
MLLREERAGERREILLSLSLSSTKNVEERGPANQHTELRNTSGGVSAFNMMSASSGELCLKFKY